MSGVIFGGEFMALGLTGGIATGKSTAAEILNQFGAEVIEADRIAHEVIKPGSEAYEDVVAHFGGEIVREDGTINRKKLGKIVFSDARQRQKLEKLTHPHIIRRIKEVLEENNYNKKLVAVIPLLYENELQNLFESVWVVTCNQEIQLDRLQKRDDLSRAEACQRLSAQMNLSEKEARADKVFRNDGSKRELKVKLKRAWQEWMESDDNV